MGNILTLYRIVEIVGGLRPPFFVVHSAYEIWPNGEQVMQGQLEPITINRQTRSVMGQNEDGSPNGEDYDEERLVSEWVRVENDG